MSKSSWLERAKWCFGTERINFPPGLVYFTVAYTLIAGIYALVEGNTEFVFYIIVMVVLATVITIVHQRVALTSSILWCFSIWGLLHMAGGLVPVPETWQIRGAIRVLYSLWLIPDYLKYDQVVHAYGFGITTWLCWQALRVKIYDEISSKGSEVEIGEVQPSLGLITLCVAGGMGFGAFNEVVEFIATLTIPNTNVGGYENTGWDLVFNLLGSVAAACFISWKSRINLSVSETE
ncbi:MAG: hypothetical protein ACI9R3_002958 [Verrucomicrobiales bacterium]|jgi:hypothetical protein